MYSRSHGSARDGVGAGGAADPSAEDVHTRRPDVKNRAVVGERRLAVARIDRTNRVSGRDTCRARRSGVDIAVSGSDGEVQAAGDGSANGRVDGGVGTAAEGQVCDRRTAGGAGLVVGIVDAGDDVGVSAGARVGED